MNIYGTDGPDFLYGTARTDISVGLAGADYLYGGNGDDGLFGGEGPDVLDGGEGFGTWRSIGIRLSLSSSTCRPGTAISAPPRATFCSTSKALIGSVFGDGLFGSAEDDIFDGFSGNDYLSGGDGNDHLYGSYGDDIILPGSGQDEVNGGSDNDTVDYSTAEAASGPRCCLAASPATRPAIPTLRSRTCPAPIQRRLPAGQQRRQCDQGL